MTSGRIGLRQVAIGLLAAWPILGSGSYFLPGGIQPAQGCSGNAGEIAGDPAWYELAVRSESTGVPTDTGLAFEGTLANLDGQEAIDALALEVAVEGGATLPGRTWIAAELGDDDFYVGGRRALVVWMPDTPLAPETPHVVRWKLRGIDRSTSLTTGPGAAAPLIPPTVSRLSLHSRSIGSGNESCGDGWSCTIALPADEAFHPMLRFEADLPLGRAALVYDVLGVPGKGTPIDPPRSALPGAAQRALSVSTLFTSASSSYCLILRFTDLATGHVAETPPQCSAGCAEDQQSVIDERIRHCANAPSAPVPRQRWCAQHPEAVECDGVPPPAARHAIPSLCDPPADGGVGGVDSSPGLTDGSSEDAGELEASVTDAQADRAEPTPAGDSPAGADAGGGDWGACGCRFTGGRPLASPAVLALLVGAVARRRRASRARRLPAPERGAARQNAKPE